mgnify:CR=1 FL=1
MPEPTLVEEFKQKVWASLGRQPFYPFRLVMDSGDVLSVEHPENFAMWPGKEANSFVAFIDGGRYVHGHFAKITAVESKEDAV